jgi:pantoate--beta-alanine ligase
MIIAARIEEVRRVRWADPTLSWGFVPTMGYLHAGHLSLVQRARQENDRVAVSIYVNPTQFAPTEDLNTYPRDLERDLALVKEVGTDLVFTPSDAVMYPPDCQTQVTVREVSKPLEGASRASHFAGVATVVTKLCNIVQPARAYFGQKDAQQTVVLRQMVRDLNINLDLIVCPTVREPDGLAMSSRNVYLSPEARVAATVLYRALSAAYAAVMAGQRQAAALRQLMTEVISAEPLARIDYVSAADPVTLIELTHVTSGVLLSMAVFFGQTRLIDNLLVEIAECGVQSAD